MTIKGLDDFGAKIQALGDHADGMCKACVWEGAKIVADQIKSNLQGLPVDSWRPKNVTLEPYNVLTATNKADLTKGLGIDDIELTGNGAETVVGFAGYGSAPSAKYPNGLPNAMLARAIESGSSARRARPFVRPAVNSSKSSAQAAMARKGDEFMKNLTK